jgi:hypothetical protein
MKNLLKLILIIILLGALIYLIGGSYNSNQTSDNTSSGNSIYENLTIKVIIPDQAEQTYPAYSISDLTLEQVLERIMVAGEFSFKTEKSSFGSYITTVNNVEADSSKQYWSIAINGEDAMQGISDINPVNGDIITLSLKDL